MKMNDFIILDGAMGTMLQAAGLPAGSSPEAWNLEQPDIITQIGKKYVSAGSDIIYANTFGANRHKLKGLDIPKVVFAGVKAAKNATAGSDCRVALDIGPIGQLLEPLGTLKFEEAYDIFKEIVIAGENAGADLIVFETMSDLYEVKAGVLAAKENTSLPIFVTMTFEQTGRTFLGVTVPTMAMTLEGLGVDAIGFNCSLGPKELMPLVKTLTEWTNLPIILKPNAGLPDPVTGNYAVTPKEFAEQISNAVDLGITVFGGCCGTTPEFIKAVKEELSAKSVVKRKDKKYCGVCSGSRAVTLDRVRVVGERINPTGKKRFQQALKEMDISYILSQGIEQQDAGAEILDVNVGLPEINEPDVMKRVIKELQRIVDLPLQIDSSDICTLENGLRFYNGKPIVNSVNGEENILNSVLPLCKKYGAAVIGLTMDENGIPETAEQRIEIAQWILNKALEFGIPKEDVIIDCLTLTVSAQQNQAKETLKAVKYVTEVLGLKTTLGVSNISFGLPARENITSAFLLEALANGLVLPIVNPNVGVIMDTICSHRVLSCDDTDCNNYIERFSNPTENRSIEKAELNINSAILKGLREETAYLTKKALENMSEIDVINKMLIPALDLVGEGYEKKKIFLPQLINAANAACEGFEVIKKALASRGEASVSKGKILVATVKGDIHDIGKNIVKVVLENYGYTVIDLGRDVDPEAIVKRAVEENIGLIGLSALMTTTAPNMAKTVELLRKSGHNCKIWVGGAVITPEYSAEIGADYYAADAKQSVDIAKKVLG